VEKQNKKIVLFLAHIKIFIILVQLFTSFDVQACHK